MTGWRRLSPKFNKHPSPKKAAWRFYRGITVISCAVLALLFTASMRPPITFDGPIFDYMILARSLISPAAKDPSQVVIVGFDAKTLASNSLNAYPMALQMPVLARIVDIVFDAGADAIGFDILFAYDPGRLPGVKTDFGKTFVSVVSAHRDKIVLGSSRDTLPNERLLAAAGPNALASLYTPKDPDGRYRRVMRGYWRNQRFVPTLAAALVNLKDGSPQMPNEVLIAPRRSLETIPTFSVLDILNCAQDKGTLARIFKNKLVIVGVTLPLGDRLESSSRLLPPPLTDSSPIATCGLRLLGASNPETDTIPGVYLHAAAVNEVLEGDVPSIGTNRIVGASAAIATALVACFGMFYTPWAGIIAALSLDIILFLAAVSALLCGYYLPVAMPMLAASATPMATYVVRYFVEERTRRRIQLAFNRYLSPALVDRLIEDAAKLSLGGEQREITILFADLSGFTALSATMTPAALTSKVNRYFNRIVAPIDATGGFVERFVGDAVVGMWGAPGSDPHHAVNAVRAAIAIVDGVRLAREEDGSLGDSGFTIKVGINSGVAVVGNIGSENRYSYTAMGEDVNIAARLESIPPLYGCTVVVGESTAQMASEHFLMRELDWVLVKGAAKPIAIYQPIVELAHTTDQHKDLVLRFAQALAHYRAMRFADAYAEWSELATGYEPPPSPSSVMAARAYSFMQQPPPLPWNPVDVLTSK